MGFWKNLFTLLRDPLDPQTPLDRLAPLRHHSISYATPFRFCLSGVPVTLHRKGETITYTIQAPQQGTYDEHARFLDFYITTPVGPRMLLAGNSHSIALSFDAWKEMHGPQDRDGKLLKRMQCIGVTLECVQCGHRTTHPSGLCQIHQQPGKRTMWNTLYTSSLDPPQIKKRLAQERRCREREQRTEEESQRMRTVAAGIQYTATDKQIYFLLELGVAPSTLQGITKVEASKLISDVLESEGTS